MIIKLALLKKAYSNINLNKYRNSRTKKLRSIKKNILLIIRI